MFVQEIVTRNSVNHKLKGIIDKHWTDSDPSYALEDNENTTVTDETRSSFV